VFILLKYSCGRPQEHSTAADAMVRILFWRRAKNDLPGKLLTGCRRCSSKVTGENGESDGRSTLKSKSFTSTSENR